MNHDEDNNKDTMGPAEEGPEQEKKPVGSTRGTSKKKMWIIAGVVACLCVAVLVFSVVGIAGKEEPVVESVLSVPQPASFSQPVISEPEPEPEPVREIPFEDLLEQNQDVIGWIELPGTVIDYPVMAGRDNAYYLSHDIDHNYDPTGEVFVDMYNETDFSDPVTVLYGHYWEDESYFTQLHRYKDPEHFDEYKELTLYLPEETKTYEVVAAFTTGNQHLLYGHDFENQNEMQGFLDFIEAAEDQENANVEMQNLTTEDHLLVMSTCTQLVGGNNRFLVVARCLE